MAVKHTINGIEFTDIKTSNLSFNPLVYVDSGANTTEDLNEQYGVGGDLPKLINAVEIDWNGADFSSIPNQLSAPSTINTTGDLLKAIKYASTTGIGSGNGLTDTFGKTIESPDPESTALPYNDNTEIVTGISVENGRVTSVSTSTLGNLREAILGDATPTTIPSSTPMPQLISKSYKEFVRIGELFSNHIIITNDNPGNNHIIYYDPNTNSPTSIPIHAYRVEYSKFDDGNTVETTMYPPITNQIYIDGGDNEDLRNKWGTIEVDSNENYKIVLTPNEPSEGHEEVTFVAPHHDPGNDTPWNFTVKKAKRLSTQVP